MMLNKFTKITVFLEMVIIILVVLTFFDFEFANIDPDELFIGVILGLLILSLTLSIIGAYKEFHKDTISKRKLSLLVVFSVPLLAVAAVLGIVSSFNF